MYNKEALKNKAISKSSHELVLVKGSLKRRNDLIMVIMMVSFIFPAVWTVMMYSLQFNIIIGDVVLNFEIVVSPTLLYYFNLSTLSGLFVFLSIKDWSCPCYRLSIAVEYRGVISVVVSQR